MIPRLGVTAAAACSFPPRSAVTASVAVASTAASATATVRSILARASSRLPVTAQYSTSSPDQAAPSASQPLPTPDDSRLVLTPADEPGNTFEEEVVAVLYGWMRAPPRALDKYAALYRDRGIHTVAIRPTIGHVLRPDTAVDLGHSILDYVEKLVAGDGGARRRVIVGGFSVGGYLFAQTAAALQERAASDGDRAAAIQAAIVGQVFDSPVDYEGIPHGLPVATTDNVVLQKAMEASIRAFLSMAKSTSAKHRAASALFHNTPIAAPTLVYFSDDDPIASPTPCLAVIDKWRAKGIDVRYHHWPVSEHVQHLRRHTDEYLAGFDGFLGDILTPRQGLGSS